MDDTIISQMEAITGVDADGLSAVKLTLPDGRTAECKITTYSYKGDTIVVKVIGSTSNGDQIRCKQYISPATTRVKMYINEELKVDKIVSPEEMLDVYSKLNCQRVDDTLRAEAK